MQTTQARLEAVETQLAQLAHAQQQDKAQATVTGYPAAVDIEAPPPEAAMAVDLAPPTAPPAPLPPTEPNYLCYAGTFSLYILLAFANPAVYGVILARQAMPNMPVAATVTAATLALPALPEWPLCSADVSFQAHDGATHTATVLLLARECGALLVGTLTPVCYRWDLPSQLIAGDCPWGALPQEVRSELTVGTAVAVCLFTVLFVLAVLFIGKRDFDEEHRLWVEYRIKQAVDHALEQAGGEPADECTPLMHGNHDL